MICGHGIDLQEVAAVAKAYEKRPGFATKVLTPAEFQQFDSLSGQRKMTYLAGRWAAKEAFSKALGTGIGKLGFQDMEILWDDKGAPCVTKSPTTAKVWISISHSGGFVQASVILEEADETK